MFASSRKQDAQLISIGYERSLLPPCGREGVERYETTDYD